MAGNHSRLLLKQDAQSESPELTPLAVRLASPAALSPPDHSHFFSPPRPQSYSKPNKRTAKLAQRRALCKNCNRRRVGSAKSNLCLQCDAAATAVSSTELQSPAAHHMQMLSTFLYAYYNVKPGNWRDSYLQQMFSLDISSPMLSGAIETLCLAHLGSKHSDDRLIIASQSSYGKALSALRSALDPRGDMSHRPAHREVLASILLISHHIEGIPKQQNVQENHLTHLLGGERYVDAYGPSCVNLDDPFDEALLSYLRFQSFLAGVAARRRTTWAKPEWRALDKTNYWLNLMIALPNILERADSIIAHPTPVPHQYLAVCRELESYRTVLLEKVTSVVNQYPEVVCVDDFDEFDMEIEEHCFISSSATFKYHIRKFEKTPLIVHCAVSWVLCLITDCTILRILRCRSPSQNAELEQQFGRTFDDIERIAYGHAHHLCRVVYLSSKIPIVAVAEWIHVFIEVAQTFFAEYGALAEMGWCQACLIATKMRIDRLRPLSRPTLCRVGDLRGPYCEAVKYQPGHWK